MATSLNDMETKILNLLNRDSTNRGYYTSAKITDAVNEALEDLSTLMQIADEGWLRKIGYKSPSAGDTLVAIPTDAVLIYQVRYKIGNVYQPIMYNSGEREQYVDSSAGFQQFPSRYRLLEGNLEFNPPLAEGGTDFLQFEYSAFPTELASGFDEIPDRYNRAMIQYIKYAAACILHYTVSNEKPPYEKRLVHWTNKITQIVEKRNQQTQYMREFEG